MASLVAYRRRGTVSQAAAGLLDVFAGMDMTINFYYCTTSGLCIYKRFLLYIEHTIVALL